MRWPMVIAMVLGCGSADSSSSDGSGSGASDSEASGSGMSTGSASDSMDSATGADQCTPYPLDALDAECSTVGSAQMFLDEGSEAQTVDFEWLPGAIPGLSHTPNTGTTAVTVRLRYDGGEITCTPWCDPCAPGENCPGIPDPTISIELLVDLSTEDGALAETWPAVLTGGTLTDTSFAIHVAVDDVQGSMVVEGDFTELELVVGGSYHEGQSQGYLSVNATSASGTTTSTSIGQWPPSA